METKTPILICDDERGIRESLKLILAEEYVLSFVTNGKQAVEYLRRENPPLLIMDIKMPQLNGLEALKEIKAVRPNVRVLIISGYEAYDVATQAFELGADEYLVKPFEKDKIRSVIRTLLAK